MAKKGEYSGTFVIDKKTGKLVRQRKVVGVGDKRSVNSATPSLVNPNSCYSRILGIFRDLGAIGDEGVHSDAIISEVYRRYGIENKSNIISVKLSRLVAKKLIRQWKDPSNTKRALLALSNNTKSDSSDE